MAITGLASENGTPMGALSVFAGGSSRNLAGYNNGEFDFLLAQSQTAPDTQAAAELCAQCEEMLLSQGVAVPLFTQQGYYAVAGCVGRGTESFFPGYPESFESCLEKMPRRLLVQLLIVSHNKDPCLP